MGRTLRLAYRCPHLHAKRATQFDAHSGQRWCVSLRRRTGPATIMATLAELELGRERRAASRVAPSRFSSNEIPTGSPDDAVAEVGHAWGLEHADELKLGLARLEAV